LINLKPLRTQGLRLVEPRFFNGILRQVLTSFCRETLILATKIFEQIEISRI